MLLMACGGGGGGGGTAAAPTPSTGGGGPTEPQALPTALITDPSATRNFLGNATAPTTTAIQAQQTFQSRITSANTLIASDGWAISSTTPGGATVSTNGNVIINGNTHRVTLAEIQMGVEDRFDLTRFNSIYAPVMVHRGVTSAEYRAAGRNGSDVFEYQSYGGWFTNSAFSVDILTINGGTDDESSLLVGISYGNATGSRPTGTNAATWEGVVVGMNRSNGNVIQGNAEVGISDFTANTINSIAFTGMVNLGNGNGISSMQWLNVPIASNGTFSSTTGGDIDGAFFGSGHTEISGTFNRGGYIGAFGGTR